MLNHELLDFEIFELENGNYQFLGYLPEDGGSQFLNFPTFNANWTIIENSKEDLLLKKLIEHNVSQNQISYNCLNKEIENYIKDFNKPTLSKIPQNQQSVLQNYQQPMYSNQQMMSMFQAYQNFNSPITSLEDKRLQQPIPSIDPIIQPQIQEVKEEISVARVLQESKPEKKVDKLNHYQNILDNLDFKSIPEALKKGEWSNSAPRRRLNVFRSLAK